MKQYFLNKKGFLLSEMLLSLMIAVIILPITITSLKLCKEGLKFETCKPDAIAIVQLRKIFTLGNDFEMQKSLEFLKTLPNDIVIYPGHGPKSTIGHEKMMNYYLNHPLSL